jgi:ribonuclease HIII
MAHAQAMARVGMVHLMCNHGAFGLSLKQVHSTASNRCKSMVQNLESKLAPFWQFNSQHTALKKQYRTVFTARKHQSSVVGSDAVGTGSSVVASVVVCTCALHTRDHLVHHSTCRYQCSMKAVQSSAMQLMRCSSV